MRLSCCGLALLAVIAAGCGKAERAEATKLSQVLTEKQPNFTNANTLEKDFLTSARAWCREVLANGGGQGEALDQNARVATELAKSLAAISAELGQVRQSVYDMTLNAEYPQSIRASLITELTKRQRMLQDMRAVLDQVSPEFVAFHKVKDYKGDAYPGTMSKLDSMLHGYKPPVDVVGTALNDLKTKYKFAG